MSLWSVISLTAFPAFYIQSGADASGSQWELWQLVNLVGAPLVALLFLPVLLEDLARWRRARREVRVNRRQR